jgi:hypothetical protein
MSSGEWRGEKIFFLWKKKRKRIDTPARIDVDNTHEKKVFFYR